MNLRYKILIAIFVVASLSSLPYAGAGVITDAYVFRPIKNSSLSVQNGDEVVPDDGAGPFYGMFEIKFTLDKSQYFGKIKVYIYIQKSGDSWKKVAEVIPGAKPVGSEMWTTKYYWNSRQSAFEWTDSDAEPCKGNLKIKFKVAEANN